MENQHRIAAPVKSCKQQCPVCAKILQKRSPASTKTLAGPKVANGGATVANTMNTGISACDCKALLYDLQKTYEKMQKEKDTRYNALREMYDLRTEELDKLEHNYKQLKEKYLVLEDTNEMTMHASSELLVVANWLLKQNEEITAFDNALIRKACERLEQSLNIASS